MIADTHAHLCDESFDTDLKQVLERASQAGVQAILAVSETLEGARKNLDLAANYEMVLPCAGLHPEHADRTQAGEMMEFIRARRSQLTAIAEVGLDYRVAESDADRELQLEVLDGFVELSLETGLPLNVHSRSAGRHVVSRLLEKGAKKVQLHAFDGKPKYALPAVDQGYFFSIPPSVVRSKQKQKLVANLPLSCMLAETDSPVLGADPGSRNEPANLALVIQALSEIKQVSIQHVQEVFSRNFALLYGVGQK